MIPNFFGLKNVKIHASKEEKPIASELPTSRPFPLLGITMNGILEFVDKCGGKDKFQGLTTTDVCERIVKNLTIEHASSYCDMLKGDTSIIKQATVFISHAWKFQFLNVLDALLRHFSPEAVDSYGNEYVLWFDLFSNNQHGLDAPPPFEWWCETFMNAVKTLGKVVMIMEPWENPIPLTRVWCLWEVYCASNTDSSFEVAMSNAESQRFRSTVRRDYNAFYKMLATVDVHKSEAWNPLDKERIFEVISRTVGFTQLNAKVFECLRGWVIRDMTSYIASLQVNEHDNLLDIIDCKKALGFLYTNMGLYGDAEIVYEECMRLKERVPNSNRADAVDVMYLLAGALMYNNKAVQAEPYYKECLSIYRETKGSKSRDTLGAMH
eukprot:gene31752-42345_t